MIVSIALGIVLAVIILSVLPFLLTCAGLAVYIPFKLAGVVFKQVIPGMVRLFVRSVADSFRARPLSRSVKLGLCLSVVIVLLFALIP